MSRALRRATNGTSAPAIDTAIERAQVAPDADVAALGEPLTPEPAPRVTGALVATLEWAAAMHEVMAALYRSLAQRLAPPGPVTAEELADRLEVGAGTIRRWESEGSLPRADRFGGKLVWERAVLDRWLRVMPGRSSHGGAP